MKNISKILAAIDMSIYSPNVLEYAIHLSHNFEANLTIANIINFGDINSLASLQNLNMTESSMKEFIDNEKNSRKQYIYEMLDEVYHKNINIDLVFETGIPYQSLLHIINEQCHDLLVMANKGRSNLSNVLFGSTAEKMFRHSPIAILSIRYFEH